jgi:hypothetical protein
MTDIERQQAQLIANCWKALGEANTDRPLDDLVKSLREKGDFGWELAVQCQTTLREVLKYFPTPEQILEITPETALHRLCPMDRCPTAKEVLKWWKSLNS